MILALIAPALLGQALANVPAEIAFESKGAHADPFNEVTLDAVFSTPSGRTLRVPAFWAGGKAWKVRYASGEVGRHRYRTESSDPADPGLHGVEGEIAIAPYVGDNPFYKHGPIRIADDGRHFAHADGTPFFWLGDTWWMGLCNRLRWPGEFETLAADRAAKGFNVVQLVAGLYPDMPPFDPRGANDAGFPWEPDFARIRPAFFDDVDRRIDALVGRGLSPCIAGMWGYFLPLMGEKKASQHWRYLIARYGASPVTWCVAGEANLPYYLAKGFPFDDREQARGWTTVARFVKANDPYRRPLTVHPTAINEYTSRHAIDDPGLLDFDMLQTPHGRRPAAEVTLRAIRSSFEARPRMPVVDGEASFERLMDDLPTEWTRAMFWICLASGAAGHTYGANGIWQCNRRGQPHGASPHGGNYGSIPWDEAMSLPGSTQVGLGKAFLTRFDWARFEPHPDWASADEGAAGWPEGLGRWIWFPEGKPPEDAPVEARYFRRTFDVAPTGPIPRARLLVSADDRFSAWINGRQVASGGLSGVESVDLTPDLRPGRNVLAIRAENLPAPVTRNPAGLLAAVEGAGGLRFGTDARWKAGRAEATGWRDPAFDDSKWPEAADLGPPGMAPWGPIRTQAPFPPLAFGIEGGPRLVYMLDPRAVVFRKLAPGKTHRLLDFDPVTGASAEGTISADSLGSATVGPPAHGHDRLLVLLPAAN